LPQSSHKTMKKNNMIKSTKKKEHMTIVHSKNSTIGYDTVNKCVASVRTPENTSYETMIKICIDKLINGDEIEKYKSALINMAKMMDKENI
jgi:hypothetical protein